MSHKPLWKKADPQTPQRGTPEALLGGSLCHGPPHHPLHPETHCQVSFQVLMMYSNQRATALVPVAAIAEQAA